MKVRCVHGYFFFEEDRTGQFSDFVNRFGLSILPNGDHFTFEALVGAPRYAIAGNTYLGAPATVTYEGEPWEIMRANQLIYNFETGLVQSLLAVTQLTPLRSTGRYFLANGLILPGSLTDEGSRVTDYSARYSDLGFKYSEVTLV
jgi:hypothetical protein